jgi:hypothetical protein
VSAVVLLGVCAAAAGGLASGCGEASWDAREPRGSFSVRVVRASFPTVQAVSRPVRLTLTVRNTSVRTLPDVAIAVDSFSYVSRFPNLASNQRPVWIIDRGPGVIPSRPVETVQVNQPGSGTTATANIWALGPLAPRASRSFVWRVPPVKPGLHTVSWCSPAQPQRPRGAGGRRPASRWWSPPSRGPGASTADRQGRTARTSPAP